MGKLQVNGDLLLAAGDEDRFLTFNYTGGTGYDWRIGYLGSGSGNENFLVFQSDKEGSTFYNALKFGLTTLNAEFGGTVTASSFIGNLSGTATHATYLNTVAGNEIRIHNATGLTNGGSLWLGWAWADGNKTVTKDWYIGNFSGGGLANIYASTFNGSLNGNATSASSAPWSGITGKPSTFTPSSHTHNYIEPKGIYTFTSSTLPNSFDFGISCGFVDHNAGFGDYGSVLTVRTYDGGGGTLQLYAPYSPTYGGTRLKARFGNYDSSSGNSWTSLKEIAWLSDLNSYLPLNGGTLTGAITLPGNRYYASGNYGLNCQNSDIVEANGIYFGDLVDGGGEGINFSRDSSTWDTLYAKSGGLYFHPNRAMETTPNGYAILHSNNYTSYTVTKTGSGASGTWGINVTGSAGSVAWRNVTGKPSTFTPSAHTHTYLVSGGTPTSTSSHADALQKYFNRNKASIPRDCLLTYYSSAMSNGSQYMGYFLSNYDSTPYGGFFVAHYNNPYYVGISYGSYIQQHILTSTNYESYAVSVAGGTMTGTLEIKGSGSDRATLEVFSSSNIPCDLWLGSNNLTKWSITCRASDENYMLGLYNKDNNYSLHIKPTGEIIFDKPGHQYGSSFPSSPAKGQIFFKT